MSRFRYILYFIAGASLMISCQKEVAKEAEYDGNKSITFSAALYTPQTKASFTDGSFTVNAWTKGTVNNGQWYMKNVTVSKNGSVYTPEADNYYWPKTDSLVFVATHGSWHQWENSTVCSTLTTGDTIEFKPIKASSTDAPSKQLLYTDQLGPYTWKNASVPIVFKNALASVTAQIRVRRFDDAVELGQKLVRELSNPNGSMQEAYCKYTVRSDTSSRKDTSYVIRCGNSPNYGLDSSKLALEKKITHIWVVEAVKIEAVQVANKGRLDMSLDGTNGTWSLPSDSVWAVPARLNVHQDSVTLFDSSTYHHTVPIAANFYDFSCDFGSEYYVIPQDLNWSSASSVNNPKADVVFYVADYMTDSNNDGVFDYRDVYQYYVADTLSTKKDTVLVYKPSVLDSIKTAQPDNYSKYKFLKWYNWYGDGVTVLKTLHDMAAEYYGQDSFGYSKPLQGITPYLDYDVKTTITLSDLSDYKKWGINTKTTYVIMLDPVTKQITFNPSVATWDSARSVSTE